jgi:hypothetical protein
VNDRGSRAAEFEFPPSMQAASLTGTVKTRGADP